MSALPIQHDVPSHHHSNSSNDIDNNNTKDDDINNNNNNSSTTNLPLSRILSPSTLTLCVCMLTHSYLLISIFPYAPYMAMHLCHVDETTAGKYAGYMASAFMLGRALTSYAWGTMADVYGRKTVLCWSLGGSGMVSLVFGMAPNYTMALLARFALGLCNGIMGTTKTLVSELSHNHEELESKTMTLVIGMWGWGFLMCPAVAGFLADPIQQYPDQAWLQEGVGRRFLEAFPFVLPNILGAVSCGLAMCGAFWMVEETLESPRSIRLLPLDIYTWCKEKLYCKVRYQRVLDKDHMSDMDWSESSSDGIDNHPHNIKALPNAQSNAKQSTSILSFLSRKSTRTCLCVYWGFSFVSLCTDELFPLFCVSHQAGLGLVEHQIGQILSVCGILFVVGQYSVCTALYTRFGLYGSIRVGLLLSSVFLFAIPLSIYLNQGHADGDILWSTFVYLSVCLAATHIFALMFFSSISVATNRSVPSSERAAINGLSVLGGSIAKGLGPTFAGYLTWYSVSWFGSAGSWLMFGTAGIAGVIVMLASFLFLRADELVEEEHAVSCELVNATDPESRRPS
jgi:MFS family permease